MDYKEFKAIDKELINTYSYMTVKEFIKMIKGGEK